MVNLATKKNLLFVLFLNLVLDVNAQDLINQNTAPIALHEKKTSAVSFPVESKVSGQKPEEVLSSKVAYITFVPKDEIDSKEFEKALRYYIPSKCTESKLVMEEVYHDTEGSEKLDIVIFDGRDSEQKRKASQVKTPTVPWDPTYDTTAGYETIDAKLQDLARALNPECLPAKFHFLYVGSKRYNEIRYGDKVWE